MLQINKIRILLPITYLLLPVIANAQAYQPGQVPAFLQNEAVQQQYRQQPQQSSSVPAFIQQEQLQQQRQEQLLYQQQMQQLQQQQNQSNYQSADPNSASFTLPPAVYQPAPGEVPAFVKEQQEQDKPQIEQDTIVKTSKKEDTIQINFSDDQYKPEDDNAAPLNKDQAAKYNAEVAPKTEDSSATSEIPEGAKFDGDAKEATAKTAATPATTSDAVIKANEPQHEKQEVEKAVPEPEKSHTNLLRISYAKEAIDLSEKDRNALLPLVRMLKSSKANHISIRAYTSERDVGTDVRKVGLMRVISIREFLMKQGVDFSQTDVKILDSTKNRENIDYIDIDKI